MDRVITLLVTMVVAAALGLAWDRRPPFSFHPRIGRWTLTWVSFDLPDGLAVQRDEAVAARNAAQAATRSCIATLGRQNASVAAVKAQGDQLRRDADKAVSVALRGRERADAEVARLLAAKPAGADVCARMLDADRIVMEGIR